MKRLVTAVVVVVALAVVRFVEAFPIPGLGFRPGATAADRADRWAFSRARRGSLDPVKALDGSTVDRTADVRKVHLIPSPWPIHVAGADRPVPFARAGKTTGALSGTAVLRTSRFGGTQNHQRQSAGASRR